MQKLLRFFWRAFFLNIGPHDFYNSFCSIRLFMDYMIFVYQVGKSMQVMLCWLFVLLLLLFIKRILKSLSKCQNTLRLSTAELENRMQLYLPGGCCNSQCALPSQEESPVLVWTLQPTLQCMRSAGCLRWDSEQAAHQMGRDLNLLLDNTERHVYFFLCLV